ncbi:NAD(P)-dependent oxidoreductase [Prochlorococcus sp. MIT 1341]|uniref:NAD(P)-dependent oxidoreductase n=1 Tax=Prochlorococcus sp. MIT 1341 TaxID=3096221 RepID=UPI002A748D32|nr:NAD(P)-dependent oxidoreductase [Prochlorococcus sp. MIT 1341]
MLSNSVGRIFEDRIKTTAVREIGDYQIVSLLCSEKIDYADFVRLVSETSSHLFVDLEKKQPLNITNKADQLNNLFKSIRLSINETGLQDKLALYPIKLNDLTVSATWKELTRQYMDISGLKLGLIGTGNIGSKLIKALTESGVKIKCFNRDINKAIAVVNSIILTKPAHTIVSPDLVRHIEHTFINTQGVIISCSDISEDISDFLPLIHKNFKIFLIGHSLLKSGALKKIKANKYIDLQRVDIGKELISYIIGTLATSSYSNFGQNDFDNKILCSGGFIGEEGALVVDNCQSPKWFYAECDGLGGLSYEASCTELQSLKQMDETYNRC